MFNRSITLPAPGTESFFLWGARQTGKTTLLRATCPDAMWIDVLKSEEFRRYGTRPELLREEAEPLAGEGSLHVVIDEIQKVPALLDEVQWLIENRGVSFALCGSSARKVKRGAAILLGGRALRYELFGMTAFELQGSFDLDHVLNVGYMPSILDATRPQRMLDAYAADYVKEEIGAEGLVRNLPTFSSFQDIAEFASIPNVTIP